MRDGVLIQEEFGGDDPGLFPWRVVIATLMCQQTTGYVVRPALRELFSRWPTPSALAWAGDELEEVLKPTGFHNKRAKTLRAVSIAFATREGPDLPTAEWVADLLGCGPYTVEAYRYVVLGDRSFRPVDKELRKAWRRDKGLL
jgi:endonuclease III